MEQGTLVRHRHFKAWSPAERVAGLERASILISTLAAVVGACVVAGWAARVPGISHVSPLFGTMNSHSAFCLLLAGMALGLLHRADGRPWKHALGRATAALLVGLSVVSLLRTWTHQTTPWDAWPVNQVFSAMFPGQMPIATALVFLSLGAALLLYDTPVRGLWPAEYLATFAGLVALLALVAYVYTSVSFLSARPRRPLAFHTVFLLLGLSVALVFGRPARGLMALAISGTTGGLMVRRLIPAAAFIPIVLGWLTMEGYRANWYSVPIAASYFSVSIIAVFGALIWATASSLRAIDAERQKAQATADRLNLELEQRVADRTAALEAANQELEAFSYSVSHDLRAPLRTIDGFSRILLEDYGPTLTSEARDYLRRVCAGSQRMGQLVDDLLSLARVARHRMERRPVDLTALAEAAVAELRRDDPDRQMRVTIQAGLRVHADANLMRVILDNLLGNAWKFTRNCESPCLDIRAVTHDGETVYVIRDNGAGFDMKYAGKLFGAFERLHAVSEFEGTGIGLATVRRIVQRHGGTVWAEGAVGRGAAFYFTVPSIEAPAQLQEA